VQRSYSTQALDALDVDRTRRSSNGRWHSILVVNLGHPGPDPWFERLPRLDHENAVRWE